MITSHEQQARGEAYILRKKLFNDVPEIKDDCTSDFFLYDGATKHPAGDARRLHIGTDCSGMEIPTLALDSLKIPYEHGFSSDSDPVVRNHIKANHRPGIFYDDVTKRDNRTAPSVDLCCGIPLSTLFRCQKETRFSG